MIESMVIRCVHQRRMGARRHGRAAVPGRRGGHRRPGRRRGPPRRRGGRRPSSTRAAGSSPGVRRLPRSRRRGRLRPGRTARRAPAGGDHVRPRPGRPVLRPRLRRRPSPTPPATSRPSTGHPSGDGAPADGVGRRAARGLRPGGRPEHRLPAAARHDPLRRDGPRQRAATAGTSWPAMLAHVERGLEEGAVGAVHRPGVPAGPLRLRRGDWPRSARPLGGLPYVTHMRGVRRARPRRAWPRSSRSPSGPGAAVHVSHCTARRDVLLPLVDEALLEGLDLTFDTYPYLRGSTILAMVALPPWYPPPNRPGAGDAGVPAVDAWWPELAQTWPRLTISHAPGPGVGRGPVAWSRRPSGRGSRRASSAAGC